MGSRSRSARWLRAHGGPSLALLVAGQVLLLALTPISRAADPMGGRAGFALLGGDSPYYLAASESLATIASEPWPRTAFLLVLWVGHRLGDAATALLVLHALVALVAGAMLHDLGARLGGRVAAWAAAAVLLVNPMVAQWFRFVQTETLFYGIIVALLWSMERARRNGGSRADWALLASLAAVAATVRPNGLVLTGAVVSFAALVRGGRRSGRALAAGAWIAVVVALALGLGATEADPDRSPAGLTYVGEVVMGAPWAEVRLTMPPPDDPSDRSLGALVRYAAQHPVAVARLPLARVGLELVQVRRHYPAVVNLAVGVAMSAFLAAVALGLRATRGHPRLPVVLLAVPQALQVAATWAIAEGRFGWGFLLPLAPTAGAGVASTVARARRLAPSRGSADRGPRGGGGAA